MDTSVDPLPTGGRCLTLLVKGQSHLSLLFSVSQGLFRETKTAREIKSEREEEPLRKHALSL